MANTNNDVKDNENFLLAEGPDSKLYWHEIDKAATNNLRKKERWYSPLFKTTKGLIIADVKVFAQIPANTRFAIY